MYQQGSQLHLTPVVKNILILNILVFIGTEFVFPNLKAHFVVRFPTSPYFNPISILTHMFAHKNISHLFFNMMGLVMFGPRIEMVWSPQKFLTYYFVCGLGAMFCQWGFDYYQVQSGALPVASLAIVGGLGASGCLFGLLAANGYLYPNDYIGIMFLPITTQAKYAVPIFAGLELFLGLGNFKTGIAHFAHIGGAVAGMLLIIFWYKTLK